MDKSSELFQTLSFLEEEFVEWRKRFIAVLDLYKDSKDEPEEVNKDLARRTWGKLIKFSMISGISEDEIQVETGVSLSTLRRWLSGEVMPRHMTRTLLAGALANVLIEKTYKSSKNSLTSDNDP